MLKSRHTLLCDTDACDQGLESKKDETISQLRARAKFEGWQRRRYYHAGKSDICSWCWEEIKSGANDA